MRKEKERLNQSIEQERQSSEEMRSRYEEQIIMNTKTEKKVQSNLKIVTRNGNLDSKRKKYFRRIQKRMAI
jgi:hypothetical protein